ncbi:unnamed protein product [Dovyalis caffra]|uniref:Uncharacterized protein n=1 Tax=Dovyalis caffra TaxID=77055 RepID=A0AAV1QLX3_9ROSI|nr:unnamed protein product [Dovyalis caffra]
MSLSGNRGVGGCFAAGREASSLFSFVELQQIQLPITKNHQISQMGLINNHKSCPVTESHQRIHKFFTICNYILLCAATSCIFLTLSLRLFPSLCGFFVILLHMFTITAAVSGCSAALSGSNKWYAAHMVSTSLTAIFQGSVSVLIFTQTGDFLGYLKSYVREEDGAVILKLAGGLCVLIFCLEWVVLVLAFWLRYYAFVEGNGNGSAGSRNGKVQEDELKNWPWPLQF